MGEILNFPHIFLKLQYIAKHPNKLIVAWSACGQSNPV